ncbi:MAG: hypothetical protein R3F43_00215 [bacterium]
MIGTVLLAALALPDDVGSPPPGSATVMAGFDRRPFLELRLGLLDWLGLRLEGEVAEAPRLGVELRVAAGDGGGGLAAHTWLRGHLRPGEEDALISGADLAVGVGVVGHKGGAFVRFDGGLVQGSRSTRCTPTSCPGPPSTSRAASSSPRRSPPATTSAPACGSTSSWRPPCPPPSW